MNNRIRKFMESQGLSPSELADNIGVQRSNVSHVLNGRNNPSFPFIEKLLKKYPKLNAKWLLMGEGEMMEGKPKMPVSLFDNEVEITEKQPENHTEELIKEEPKPIYSAPKNIPVPEAAKSEKDDNSFLPVNAPEEKPIQKIIVFYSDQTFRVYQPAK